MTLLFYLPLLIPALAALAARPLASRLEPRAATWLLTAATAALAGFSTVALALLAASAAARVPLLASLGHYSPHVLGTGDPVSALTGLVAAAALTGAAVAVAVAVRRRARALAESFRRAGRLPADGSVVVLPGPAIEAYALPGWPGRIVVSGRLLSTLDDGGRAALLAHEQAHLSGRHHLFAAVAHLAAAANPLLLPLARAVDFSIERWADESAARVTGDRRLVAATIGRVALLTTAVPAPSSAASRGSREFPAGAFGIIRPARGRVSVAWAGPVPRRVAALLAPPPPVRAVLLAVAALVIMLAGVSALEAARNLHALLELAQSAR
jgi:Zn-dependent protease with chaperone function